MIEAGHGLGFCVDLFNGFAEDSVFCGLSGIRADPEMAPPIVYPFSGAETRGEMVLLQGQCPIVLFQGLYAGFLPEGFGIDQ